MLNVLTHCCLSVPARSRCGCAGLRPPLFAFVFAVAAKWPSMQALVKLAATLRLSLASGSLDGSACSLTSADTRASRTNRGHLADRLLLRSAVHRRLLVPATSLHAGLSWNVL